VESQDANRKVPKRGRKNLFASEKWWNEVEHHQVSDENYFSRSELINFT
jgi:hypothetical protein